VKPSSDRQIEEAINLLDVLEQFSVCLSESEFNVGEIAWEGYLQTITEVKRKLYNVLDIDSSEVAHQQVVVKRDGQLAGILEAGDDEGLDLRDDSSIGAGRVSADGVSIVSRIKKLPPARRNRVRELRGGGLISGIMENEG